MKVVSTATQVPTNRFDNTTQVDTTATITSRTNCMPPSTSEYCWLLLSKRSDYRPNRFQIYRVLSTVLCSQKLSTYYYYEKYLLNKSRWYELLKPLSDTLVPNATEVGQKVLVSGAPSIIKIIQEIMRNAILDFNIKLNIKTEMLKVSSLIAFFKFQTIENNVLN